MTTSKNDFKNVSLQNLVDNPDCTEDDVAQWVRANDSLFEDESNPGEISQDKVNKLFEDVMQNNALGSFGNLGIDYSSVVDWFDVFGKQGKEKKPQQGGDITGSVLTWGKKILGIPGASKEKTPGGGFGMGKFDLGSLMKYSKNPQLKKVLWLFDTIIKEIKKYWPTKRRRTTRSTTAKRATTSRSRTTTARKTTTTRSTTAKKTVAKKTPARTTTAKKTVAKKTTTRSTTAKKTR